MFTRIPTLHAMLILTCAITVTFVACDNDNGTNPQPQLNLWESVQTYEALDRFVEEAEGTGIADQLSQEGAYTLLSPTNDAFDRLPEEMLDTLSTDQMEHILQYHFVEESFTTEDLEQHTTYESALGEELYITVDDSVYINGETVMTAGNIAATNGYLHALDEVLLPDSYLTAFGIIAKRYSLQTLQQTLAEAELADMLDNAEGAAQYTVLAPSESALSEVDLPDNSQELADLLEYHIIEERLLAEDLQDGQTIETMLGEQITIQKEGDAITVNENASVTTTDLAGTNGVVHIIDAALTPPSE